MQGFSTPLFHSIPRPGYLLNQTLKVMPGTPMRQWFRRSLGWVGSTCDNRSERVRERPCLRKRALLLPRLYYYQKKYYYQDLITTKNLLLPRLYHYQNFRSTKTFLLPRFYYYQDFITTKTLLLRRPYCYQDCITTKHGPHCIHPHKGCF
ncbi:hypothetical protein T484DRAFT_2643088 [Baffinella frigidus]|nr:hypothetical protein T484DRAFT_2643088 [Cryptophyta sp. CCMP2293]